MKNDINVPPSEIYALIVGIGTYNFEYGDTNSIKLENLKGTATSAINFADWLISRNVPPDNIYMFVSPLSQEEENLLRLLDKVKSLHDGEELLVQAASKKCIEDTINSKLLKRDVFGRLLYVFWSGHGFISNHRHILPVNDTKDINFGNLDFNSLLEELKLSTRQSGFDQQIYFIDTCANLLGNINPKNWEEGKIGLVPSENRFQNNKQFVLFAAAKYKRALGNSKESTFFSSALMEVLNNEKLLPKECLLPDMLGLTQHVKQKLKERGQPEPAYICDWNGNEEKNSYPIKNQDLEYDRVKILANTHKKAEYIAKEQLKPEILEKIPRPSILDKCLKEIYLSVKEKQNRIVPIIGSAGFGKSVILGNIYEKLREELVESGKVWIAVVRCDDIIDESGKNFGIELGEKASGYKESITKIAEILSNHGEARGVLLIDTLDIVLSHKLVMVLREIFRELLEYGTTIVFTCRHVDYEFYFEPYHEKFSGFHHSVKPCEIMEFEDTDENPEVQTAVRYFFRDKLEVKEPEIIEDSIQGIIELSAQNSSLKEITCNPLLLALLCQLFFSKNEDHEQIPEDFTVSQLYDKYWERKVALRDPRKPSQDSRVGGVMENLCLKIAESMYVKSANSLHNSIYKNSLNLNNPHTLDKEAYETLKSNGVLKSLDKNERRITFLHQTFIEYAIAYWFASTESGETAKSELFREIINSSNDDHRSYMYPVIRQLLTIEDINNFYDICKQLDTNKPLPFRTIAPASVSRTEPEASSVFSQLLPIAHAKGKAYQKELLRAGNSALKPHIETVWKVVLELLQKCDQELLIDLSLRAGKLLGRFDTDVSLRLEKVLQIIDFRDIKNKEGSQKKLSYTSNNQQQELDNPHNQTESSKNNLEAISKNKKYQHERRCHLVANFIGGYSRTIKVSKRSVDIETLNVFKECYFKPFCSSETRAKIIDLYLHLWLPEQIRQELDKTQSDFLLEIIKHSTSDRLEEKESASILLKSLLPSWLKSGDSAFGESWLTALHARLPASWYIIQARSVGLQAIQDTELMGQLLSGLFDDNPVHENIRRHKVAIDEAICNGGGNFIASILLKIKIETIPRNRISAISTLLKKLPGHLDMEYQINLAQWFLPIAHQNIFEVATAIDKLAHNSQEVEQLLVQLLVDQVIEQSIIDQRKKNQIIEKLDHVPEQIQGYLYKTREISESRLALAKLYRIQAEKYDSEDHLSKLIDLCLDKSEKVSLEASRNILKISENNEKKICLEALIPIVSKSNVVGVCQNCLDAVIKMIGTDSCNSNSGITIICKSLVENQIFQRFSIDRLIQVIKSWYRLIEVYIRVYGKIAPDLLQLTLEFTNKIVQSEGQPINGGIAASALITLKNIANLEDEIDVLGLGKCTRAVLRAISVDSSGDNSFIIGLLDKIARFDEKFLSILYEEDFFREDGSLPTPNMQVVVVAIAYNQGKRSNLLIEMLRDSRICEQVKNTIRQEQGY
jgi:hypothetical protein